MTVGSKFRNGSPVARALSIASRSGLEQARHFLGIGQTSIGVKVVVKVRRTRSYSASTCGFQIRCFVFSATLSAYPAASAAFLSLRPLSFPNKNNRCLSVRPFLSSDLRRSSCSSRVGGFGSSKSSGLKSCEIRCFIAALSETIILLERPIDLPHGAPRKNVCQQFHPTPDLYSVSPSLLCVWPEAYRLPLAQDGSKPYKFLACFRLTLSRLLSSISSNCLGLRIRNALL